MSYHFTNKHDASLALVTFLLHDSYDYDERTNAISVTTLMRPLRQIVLTQQFKDKSKTIDVMDLVASRMGQAIHSGCEEAWSNRETISKALQVLGATDKAINAVKINPVSVKPGEIPVYVEQRTEREILGYILTGKFDLALDGYIHDFKSTSVWGFIYDSNASKHALQGSLYKWLNPDKITSNYINIHYIFTDWSSSKARQDPRGYPKTRAVTKQYPLMGMPAVEEWIQFKLKQYTELKNKSQSELPLCTDEELWATQTVHKYYNNPNNMSRATKNFNSLEEAEAHKTNKGTGIVITVPGEVKACTYCQVIDYCEQAKALESEGRLVR